MNAKLFGISALNFSFFWLTTLVVAHFQEVIWYQFFGSIPSPALWLLPIVYLSQKRSLFTGLVQTYLICLGVATVTVMPVGLLMAVCGLVFATTLIFKGRIYWDGTGYQMLIAAIAIAAFQIYNYVLSWILEPNPILYPQILVWTAQIILTSAMSPLFYFLFDWFDHLTGREVAVESEMQA